MPALTRSVLSMAIHNCAAWRKLGHDLTVAVNLSASELHDVALPVLVRDTLAEHGVPAEVLVLEITETNVVVNPARAERTLGLLHELGVVLSVDDYGTGHCSLSYLRRLPAQELKLDRSFLRDMATEPRDEAIMQSSVEDAVAAQLLAGAGCDLAQGWPSLDPCLSRTCSTGSSSAVIPMCGNWGPHKTARSRAGSRAAADALRFSGVRQPRHYLVGRVVCWSRRSRTHVPRHAGLMSHDIPD